MSFTMHFWILLASSRASFEIEFRISYSLISCLKVVGELSKSSSEVEDAARNMDSKELENMNKAFDEYILRQMRFKSEIMDEIAR
jgi:hypothetical protein